MKYTLPLILIFPLFALSQEPTKEQRICIYYDLMGIWKIEGNTGWEFIEFGKGYTVSINHKPCGKYTLLSGNRIFFKTEHDGYLCIPAIDWEYPSLLFIISIASNDTIILSISRIEQFISAQRKQVRQSEHRRIFGRVKESD